LSSIASPVRTTFPGRRRDRERADPVAVDRRDPHDGARHLDDVVVGVMTRRLHALVPERAVHDLRGKRQVTVAHARRRA
jgi:hypothetical protein